jgi:hypothetical protein
MVENMKIQTKCYTCGATNLQYKPAAYQYVFQAYNRMSIDWSDCERLISKEWRHESWQIGQYKKPILNERRVISVGFPFSANVNESFWVHYINPDSINMDITKNHIEDSAFFNCKILDLLDSNGYSAWILVEIVEKIDTKDIITRIPEQKMNSEFIKNFYFFKDASYDCFDNWIYYTGSAQSDLSESILIYNSYNKYNVVTFGTDSTHNSWEYLTNISIPETLVFDLLYK